MRSRGALSAGRGVVPLEFGRDLELAEHATGDEAREQRPAHLGVEGETVEHGRALEQAADEREVVGARGERRERLRELELKKAPSIAESIDWARTLVALGTGTLDNDAIARTLGVVLKHASDHDRAVRELRLRAR